MRKFSLIALICLLAVLLVQSESSIEVDENGDEYEVKRFYVEGRQLNGRRQCVVRRRKRAATPTDDENVAIGTGTGTAGDDTSAGANEPSPVAAAAAGATAAVPNGLRAGQMSQAQRNKKKGNHPQAGGDDDYISTAPPSGIEIDSSYDEDSDDYDDTDSGDLPAYPDVDGHPYNHLPPGWGGGDGSRPDLSGVDGSDGDDDGNDDDYTDSDSDEPDAGLVQVNQPEAIVIVESNRPPQVNPNTHAVFELQPVAMNGAAGGVLASGLDGDLHYEEEINPVTTTAIWSTGEDEDEPHDYDLTKEAESQLATTTKQPKRKPTKLTAGQSSDKIKKNKKNKNKNKNKKTNKNKTPSKRKQKQKQKNKRNKKGKRKNNKVNKKGGKKGKRKNNKVNKKGGKKGKRGQGGKVKRRKNRRPRPILSDRNSNRFDSNNNNVNHKRKNHQLNQNTQDHNRRRKNKKDRTNINQGTNTFTKTETMTQTGTANDAPDVNCIVINRDPPTTARPFWNILGRDASAVRDSGHFGHRKRVNFRLTA